jgi:hypothetical protein
MKEGFGLAGGFSVFAGVGERTREGNDLYREMIETVSPFAAARSNPAPFPSPPGAAVDGGSIRMYPCHCNILGGLQATTVPR